MKWINGLCYDLKEPHQEKPGVSGQVFHKQSCIGTEDGHI